MATQKRPLVVIGGWLGCQPKSLRRYEALYSSLGFDTFPVVATPRSVVEATVHLYGGRPPLPPPDWPMLSSSRHEEGFGTTDELAWHVLGRVQSISPDMFLYHSFSNGGCFLWESICRVLEFQEDETCSSSTSEALRNLSSACKGVVFDSCPAWFDAPQSKLWHALRHCSEKERQDILTHYGAQVLTFSEKHKQRNQEYFQFLSHSSLDIPQLYLYCENDDLSDYEHIEMVIRTRQSFQRHPVLKQSWGVSTHCAHLREHPQDYKLALGDFLRLTTQRSKL